MLFNLKKLIKQDLLISSFFVNDDETEFPYIVNLKEHFVVSANHLLLIFLFF